MNRVPSVAVLALRLEARIEGGRATRCPQHEGCPQHSFPPRGHKGFTLYLLRLMFACCGGGRWCGVAPFNVLC